jgi:uroporphyrinogen III methyltransferase/synthase
MLRADIARPALRQTLTDAGAHVDDLSVYLTIPAAELPADVVEALEQRRVHWITFTSSSTASNFAHLLGDRRDLLTGVKLASIGPVTSDTLRKLDLPVTVEATTYHIPGLIEAIVAAAGPFSAG